MNTERFGFVLMMLGSLAIMAAFVIPCLNLDTKASEPGRSVSMDDFNPYGIETEIKPGVYVLSGNGVQKLMVVTQPICLDCLNGMAFVMPLEKLIPSDLEEALKKAKERLKEDMAK